MLALIHASGCVTLPVFPGPYLYCNDVNVTDPYGAWKCTIDLDNSAQIPGYPDTCKAMNYTPYADACYKGFPDKHNVSDFGECCSIASSERAYGWSMEINGTECSVFKTPLGYYSCNNTVSAAYYPPSNTCNCSRAHKSVGRENISLTFGSHNRAYHVAGGFWFSHPDAGECTDGHYVGDGSG